MKKNKLKIVKELETSPRSVAIARPAARSFGPEGGGTWKEKAEDLQFQLDRALMLLDITKKIAAFQSLHQMLSYLIAVATEHTQSERGTLFLNDAETSELYSEIAQGNLTRRIRISNSDGIAGKVFLTGEGTIVHDAYSDVRFDQRIDKKTGFITKSILCVPIKTAKGEIIGVLQTLNRLEGEYRPRDLVLLEDIATQAANALQNTQYIEKIEIKRVQELEFLDLVAEVTSEINLKSLLQKVMHEATRMLKAERSTLFLNDPKKQELWSEVGEGLKSVEIRFPNHLGIAGAVYTSGKTINIPYAYADLRFNPGFDKKTGYFTRSILCVPLHNKMGKIIGVTQVLNKIGGVFSSEDEARLRAFTGQVAIGLENATLFNDVQKIKNYNESVLESMTNGVITISDENKVMMCNKAVRRILTIRNDELIGQPIETFFEVENTWIMGHLKKVKESKKQELVMDAEIKTRDGKISANVTFLPMLNHLQEFSGTLIIIEDISSEKRMKSTMSRYMDPSLTEQLMDGGQELLGGQSVFATLLFSDVRGFTTITETLGAQGTVQLLNEYFTIMVDCLQKEGGILDKFVGDALMAAFGIPFSKGDDEDRGVRTAISMIRELEIWNKKRRFEKKLPVDIGIGVNSDNVVTGNIGSPKRMDYTSIGDGVNLAARLESACKQYNAKILISEYTLNKLKGAYKTRLVDNVVVKGKTKPVSIHEVLDFHDEESFPNLIESMGNFKEAVTQYRKQNWNKARQFFKTCLELNPQDHLVNEYLNRVEKLEKTPPGDDWDGVWILKSK